MVRKRYTGEQIIRRLRQVYAAHLATDRRLRSPIVSAKGEKAYSKIIHHHQDSVH